MLWGKPFLSKGFLLSQLQGCFAGVLAQYLAEIGRGAEIKLAADFFHGKPGGAGERKAACFPPDSICEWLGSVPGGMMFFLGCHLVDLIMQIQGMPQRVIPMNKATGLNGVVS